MQTCTAAGSRIEISSSAELQMTIWPKCWASSESDDCAISSTAGSGKARSAFVARGADPVERLAERVECLELTAVVAGAAAAPLSPLPVDLPFAITTLSMPTLDSQQGDVPGWYCDGGFYSISRGPSTSSEVNWCFPFPLGSGS